jgi:hypothetical protein
MNMSEVIRSLCEKIFYGQEEEWWNIQSTRRK